jgi:hypothetical protein
MTTRIAFVNRVYDEVAFSEILERDSFRHGKLTDSVADEGLPAP